VRRSDLAAKRSVSYDSHAIYKNRLAGLFGNHHVPHPTPFAAQRLLTAWTLTAWTVILGVTGISGGCAPLRLNQNDEAMMRQLDELPPAIKIETATPVGMTNREMQARQQERAALNRDAPPEQMQRRSGGPESQAPRYQPPAPTKAKATEPEAFEGAASAPAGPAEQRTQLSAATESEYLRALDQAGITDPIERTQMLADFEATEPRHRGMMLRMLRVNVSQRKKASESLPGMPKRGIQPEDVAADTDEEPLPPRRDSLAMTANDPSGEAPLRRNTRAAQPPARKMPDPIANNTPAPTANPIRQVAHTEPASPSIPTPTRDLAAAQDPEQLFRDALAGMERQLKTGTTERTAEIAAIRLRLLQALAGQREAALEPVPNLSPAQQEFLSQQVYALAALVDQQGNALWSRRAFDH
jgi:hypothetical protein